MKDLIDRQELLTELDRYIDAHHGHGFENVRVILRGLKREIIDFPCAQPQPGIIRCKDCKHWKDSDGVYRRGVDAESKCPLNIQEVYAGTFYCGYAERRTDGRD